MKFVISEKNKKDIFIVLFSIIKSNTSTISMSFKKDLVFIQGMDKSHISLFNIEIKENWFTIYDYSTLEEEIIISFDTNLFYTMINNVNKNQSISIDFDKNDFININLSDCVKEDKTEYDVTYKLSLIDNDYEFLSIPETEYDCEFLINSKKICDITTKMQVFGNDIKIECCEDFIEFTSNGTNGEMKVNLKTDDLDEFSIEEEKKFCFGYNLNYLNKMCLNKYLSDKIYFYLSSECPLKIKYDLNDEDINVCFYISPKVDFD
jgi:proliferating cell nuclear antigen PCNA